MSAEPRPPHPYPMAAWPSKKGYMTAFLDLDFTHIAPTGEIFPIPGPSAVGCGHSKVRGPRPTNIEGFAADIRLKVHAARFTTAGSLPHLEHEW